MGETKYIIGLGSGRCGTTSLAVLLDMQANTTVTHEGFIPLPWYKSLTHFRFHVDYIKSIRRFGVGGDVSFYHLNYIDGYVHELENVKFICLKRNKEDTVKSLDTISTKFGVNHFTSIDSKHWDHSKWSLTDDDTAKFRNTFPKYDAVKLDAINTYYDDYYNIAKMYEIKYPNQFRIFDMNRVLNNQEGQAEMFNFLEITPSIVVKNIKFFKGEEKWPKYM